MSELGEGDCAFQTWICPKCNDDHPQNRECKTIDLWEAEAKADLMAYEDSVSERILALIDLVRKKDDALKDNSVIVHRDLSHSDLHQIMNYRVRISKEALALTEELK